MKPKWLVIAEKELGTAEISGEENNPRIIEYHSTTTLKATHDEVPWCSSFVNWCMKQSGFEGTRNALAKSWLRWGKEIPEPVLGCICVIRNKTAQNDPNTGSATGYHVGFWLSESDDIVHMLGGNQGNRVKMSGFLKRTYEVCGYRIPEGVS